MAYETRLTKKMRSDDANTTSSSSSSSSSSRKKSPPPPVYPLTISVHPTCPEFQSLIEVNLMVRLVSSHSRLMEVSPPIFTSYNKKLLFDNLIGSAPDPPDNDVIVSRWKEMEYPSQIIKNKPVKMTMKEDSYQYEESKDPLVVQWWVNFADYELFGFYSGPLFAQDEMQSMEHPVLGSVREGMSRMAAAHPKCVPHTRTRRNGGLATPILVAGAQRRLAVNTDPDEKEGRPAGLYGNQFARADDAAVLQASRAIVPPTTSHILAMEAPKGGHGQYTMDDVDSVLATAYTGFTAAIIESNLMGDNSEGYESDDDENGKRKKRERKRKVVVHTGNWGTGAYGGNKVIMALLQMLAAHCAGIDELVHHTFDASSSRAWEEARTLLDVLVRSAEEDAVDTRGVLEEILLQGFRWGQSDGN